MKVFFLLLLKINLHFILKPNGVGPTHVRSCVYLFSKNSTQHKFKATGKAILKENCMMEMQHDGKSMFQYYSETTPGSGPVKHCQCHGKSD